MQKRTIIITKCNSCIFIIQTQIRGYFRSINSACRAGEAQAAGQNARWFRIESGNVFTMLLGAVGMVGVVSAANMTVMKGPVKTMSEVTKKTVAENNMIATTKLAMIVSSSDTATYDCDSDSRLEPVPYGPDIPGFTGGGEIPSLIGTTRTDPWGTPYAYCAWDYGTTINGGGGTIQTTGTLVGGTFRSDGRTYYFGASQRLYGDNSSQLFWDSNHSTTNQLILRNSASDELGRLNTTLTDLRLMEDGSTFSYRAVKGTATHHYVGGTARMSLYPTYLHMQGNQIKNLANPTAAQDAVTRSYMETNTVSLGDGLSGGGNLTANRTLSFDTTWGDNRYRDASNLNAGTVPNARLTGNYSGLGTITASRFVTGDVSGDRWCRANALGVILCTSAEPSGGSTPTCKANMSNIQIGDTCDDDSKFLGSHPNFGWQGFYVTDANQSTSSNWSNSITLCNNLNRHGHTDWYLPSKSELNHLYENQNVVGGFTAGYYWSSTESDSGYAWLHYFYYGYQITDKKSTNIGVRCVRRN